MRRPTRSWGDRRNRGLRLRTAWFLPVACVVYCTSSIYVLINHLGVYRHPPGSDANSFDTPILAGIAFRNHYRHQNTTLRNAKTLQKTTTTLLLPRDKFDGWMDRFLVVPEYKLLVCYIEKVGCTMFNDVARILRMVHPGVSEQERARLARKRWYVNTPRAHGLNTSDLEALHTNPEWTKAVFFWDPATRFLSAYQSKCEEPMEDGGSTCQIMFGLDKYFSKNKTFTFGNAIDLVRSNPSRVLSADWHVRPQARFCGGLVHTLPLYNVVHQLTQHTSYEMIGGLLSQVGVPQNVTEGIQDCFARTPRDCQRLQSIWLRDFPSPK